SGEDGMRPGGASTIEEEEIVSQKSNASIHYYLLMTAVLKYRDGIRKVKKLDADDLEKFYLENKDNYAMSNQKLFERTIRNLRKTYPVFGKKYYSAYVINEYMKGRGMSTFSFDDMTKDDAKKFIRENPYNLPKYDLEKVRNHFGITRRELMSGKNQVKFLKMLVPIVLYYIQSTNETIDEEILKGRNDASKYGIIKEKISSPNINTFDIIKYLRKIDVMDSDVLITLPILDLVYAHIKSRHNKIDVLTKEDIYAYVYELQKAIMQGGVQKLYDFFSKSSTLEDVFKIKDKNPRTWAFFDKLLANGDNADVFKLEYDKRDSASISPQYQSRGFAEFKNRVMRTNVGFIEDIPNKLYGVINIGDEVMQSSPDVAKDIIGEYKDHLVDKGNLIAYFKDDTNIPEIFDGESYKVVNVRTPRVGVQYGGNNPYQDKVVIMQKSYH
ncbi:MAG: hypothetical protein K2L98_03150, partial [Bacilli bacterium]|nr:hypothetical protein [Bacilli bacterium]